MSQLTDGPVKQAADKHERRSSIPGSALAFGTHLRYLFQGRDFIANHVLSPFHQSFANDFAGIVLTSLDVNRLLDNSIRALS